MANKDLEYYLRLHYTITLKRGTGDGDYWIARVLELPHCMTHGSTPEEALRDIEDARREWLKSNLEAGLPIPEPVKFTGQYHLRMPPSLHEALALKSESEDVSLNQFIVTALARAVGYAEQPKRKSKKQKVATNH
ncbi:MAG TPA: type II toxin-antitoxin system HicB family antitoxin [Dehalococcoidales bacterium]|nr:type II toxin-antitoxin system HicB family antitoxin [Dehalococcoidales bacterium]